MPATPCPTIEQLELYLSRLLAESERISIEQHLDYCKACIIRLENHYSPVVPAQDGMQKSTGRESLLNEVSVDSAEHFLERLKSNFPRQMFDRIYHYRVIRIISSGGSGEVYECMDEKLNRRVALKTIRPQMLSRRVFERFGREARIQARLSHENIVRVLDFGLSENDVPYLIMELVEGGTLRELIGKSPLPPMIVASVIEKCARAIFYAHSQNVLHRDLKPSNILINYAKVGSADFSLDDAEEGIIPKVSDFGLARYFDDSAKLTASGAVVGTPLYMSPEQASGKQNLVGPESDIYSLGVILYECLTGRPPFESDQIATTLRMIQESIPVSPRLLVPEISRDLDTICLKCLEKDPARRYSTCQELADDLTRFLTGKPVKAKPLGVIGRSYRWYVTNRILALATLVSLILIVCLAIVGTVSLVDRSNLLNLAQAEIFKSEKALRQLQIEHDRLRTEFFNGANGLRLVSESLKGVMESDNPRESIVRMKDQFDQRFNSMCDYYHSKIIITAEHNPWELEGFFRDATALRDLGRPELAESVLDRLKLLTRDARPGNAYENHRLKIAIMTLTIHAMIKDQQNETKDALKSMLDYKSEINLKPEFLAQQKDLLKAWLGFEITLQSILLKSNRLEEAEKLRHTISDLLKLTPSVDKKSKK